MIIIAVDDEKMALESVTDAVLEVDPSAQVQRFMNPRAALEYVKNNPCDVAFLDIQMFEIDGIQLAREIKLVNPRINIIFTTGFSEFMQEAFQMHASGYIMKPVTVDKVRAELKNLRHPLAGEGDPKHRVRLRCFGDFEIFVDGRPVSFKYEKAREMLAYLVDRAGAMCSTKDIMIALFEDDEHSSYMRNLRKNLLDTLKELNCADIVISEWGKMCIVPDNVDCDYFSWRRGQVDGINAYRGEYMSQYSWAEVTNSNLYSEVF